MSSDETSLPTDKSTQENGNDLAIIERLLQEAIFEPRMLRSQQAIHLLKTKEPKRIKQSNFVQTALTHTEVSVRRRTLNLIRELQLADSEFFPFVEKLLADPHWTVREAAVRALPIFLSRNEDLQRFLLPLVLRDKNQLVRETAFNTLVSLESQSTASDHEELIHQLTKVVHSGHPSEKRRAIDALQTFGSHALVLETINQALQDSHRKVRQAAAKVTAKSLAKSLAKNSPFPIFMLPNLLKRLYDQDPRVQKTVRETLLIAKHSTPQAIYQWLEILMQGSRDSDCNSSHNAEQNLSQLLDNENLPSPLLQQLPVIFESRLKWHKIILSKPSAQTFKLDPQKSPRHQFQQTLDQICELRSAKFSRSKEAVWFLGRISQELFALVHSTKTQ